MGKITKKSQERYVAAVVKNKQRRANGGASFENLHKQKKKI